MTYYRCATCNRPILFREWTDYGRQCKKCGEPVKATVKSVPHAKWRPQFTKDAVKVDPVIPEEELSLKEVKALVDDMQNRNLKAIEALGQIQDRMQRLMKELDK